MPHLFSAKNKLFSIVSTISILLFFSVTIHAAPVTYFFTFENDGDLVYDPSNPFGTLTIDDSVVDKLTFTIDIETSILGPDSDIHEFGFMMDFSDALVFDPDPTVISGVTVDFKTGGNSDKVQGRNSVFDYVVDFGSGTPYLNPVTFTLAGAGLDMTAITSAGISTQNDKENAQFMVHVQSTTTNSGSEALGGLYQPASPVPEPTTMILFGAGIASLAAVGRRKK